MRRAFYAQPGIRMCTYVLDLAPCNLLDGHQNSGCCRYRGFAAIIRAGRITTGPLGGSHRFAAIAFALIGQNNSCQTNDLAVALDRWRTAVVAPRLHQRPPLRQQRAALITGLGLVLDRMR